MVGGSSKDDGDDDSRGLPVRVSGTSIPARVLLAYRNAAAELRDSDQACHLHWSLVAGIGKVESGHAYNGALDRRGRTTAPILGPELNGVGPVAAIADSDGGQFDGDTTWDRAVGPMQFIPTSWAVWGRDGDGDGRSDPSDIDDAALAAGSYLCAGDRDLSRENDRRSAVFSYNHSWDYVDLVLAWADAYATGTTPVAGTQLAAGRDDRVDDDATGEGDGPAGPPRHRPGPDDRTGADAQRRSRGAARLGGTAQRRAVAGTEQQPVGPAGRPGPDDHPAGAVRDAHRQPDRHAHRHRDRRPVGHSHRHADPTDARLRP